VIYTVGYQRLTLDALRGIVEEKGIDRIIDVRSVPYSRKPEFNRNRLKAVFGRKYLWKGAVLGGKGRIEGSAIRWLAGQEGALLVMCMEEDPCGCHRYYEIGRRLLALGVQCVHLSGGGEHTTEELKEVCDGKRNQTAQYRLDFS
jgi:uncharacterized protein (DUF488 family)